MKNVSRTLTCFVEVKEADDFIVGRWSPMGDNDVLSLILSPGLTLPSL